MKKFVFIDESIRIKYTMAAVVVPINFVTAYRRELSRLRIKGSRSFHIAKERHNHQSRAVSVLAEIDYCELIVSSSENRVKKLARQECLTTLLESLSQGDYALVFDQTTQEKSDHATIFQMKYTGELRLEFVHLSRYLDPGLWGADILAWSVGTKFERQLRFRTTP